MGKLSTGEIFNKILYLDKFNIFPQYPLYIYIGGTGFMYDAYLGRWWKLPEPYVYTYPVPDDFHYKVRKETGSNINGESSSIEEVLETVSDDIRDTILFNINLFR